MLYASRFLISQSLLYSIHDSFKSLLSTLKLLVFLKVSTEVIDFIYWELLVSIHHDSVDFLIGFFDFHF